MQTNAYILQEKYKIFWENEGFDDSLDEITVILGSKRKIDLTKTVFIGETTFLREYYDDDSIISWSHYSFYSYATIKNVNILLEKIHVKNVLKLFKGLKNIIQKYNYPNVRNHCSSCWPELYLQKHKEYFSNWFFQTVKNYQYQNENAKISINFKDLGIFEFVVTSNHVILLGRKNITAYAVNCSWGSFRVINDQKAKNNFMDSAFIAIAKHSQSINSILPPPLPLQDKIQPKPSIKIYDGGSDLKFWDNGLNGIAGFEKMRLIAAEMKKIILIIFRKSNKQLQYLKIDSQKAKPK